MPETISEELLRRLAEFKAAEGRAISLYLDLDPAVAATQPDMSVRINAAIAETGRHIDGLRDGVTRAQREGLKADLERIERWFATEFDRDGARGVSVFADGPDGLWSVHTLNASVADEVRIADELLLAPLVATVDRTPFLVAYVGRERGDVYRLHDGSLVEIADETEDAPNKHSQGGRSQARYERHVENVVGKHLRRVAETLDRCVRRLPHAAVVLFATDETRGEFEEMLSAEVKERVAGWTTAERHASASELLAVAEPVCASWRAGRETDIVERWRELAGRDGRASMGWEKTLEAASDGRVEMLLVQEGATRPAYRCPRCGRAQVSGGACPLDGAEMEHHPDGLDLAVHRTLEHGGSVDVLRARRDLDPVEGIGAVLRF